MEERNFYCEDCLSDNTIWAPLDSKGEWVQITCQECGHTFAICTISEDEEY